MFGIYTMGMWIPVGLISLVSFVPNAITLDYIGEYRGDLILAAFFPIHGKSSAIDTLAGKQHEPRHAECGVIQSEDGIQFMEAFYLALDKINDDPALLPGIQLGAIVFDSCDQEAHVLEQAVELLRFLMTRSTLDDYPFVCEDGSNPSLKPDLERYQNVIGVIGGSSSGVSIQLASLLGLFQVSQVSYLSTSPDLSNEDRFEFFKRVVPSDNTQIRVMIEVLKEFNWTYVSVVYDDTNYGMKGYEELVKVASISGICFSYTKRIETESPDWGPSDYDKIIRKLSKRMTRVAILYTSGTHARKVFEAAARSQNSSNIIWIGGDAWSGRASVVDGLEHVLHRAITVQPFYFKVAAFDEYFQALHPKYNPRNPWFPAFWEHHFDCTLVLGSSYMEYIERTIFQVEHETLFQKIKVPSICTGNERLSADTGYMQQGNVHFVREAAYSFAHALTRLQEDRCGEGHVGMCPEMRPANFTGRIIKDYLDDITFLGVSGRNFTFVNKRDGPPRYTIKTFRGNVSSASRPGWVEIGNYSGVPGEAGFSFEPFFLDWMPEYPESVCSEPCAPGQIHVILPGDDCCWICANCSEFEIALPFLEICFECHIGYVPNDNKTRCVAIAETYMSHHSSYAIGAMSFAGVGVVATILMLIVFIKFERTPVIKASGRELSYYLLAGILMSYMATFVIVARPSVGVCTATRILFGLCYTIIYAAILTKTNRISRIFNEKGASSRKIKYTSPKSQMVIVNVIVLIEIIIIAGWMAAARPRTRNLYPSRYSNIVVCDGSQDARYLVPLVFPLMLLIFCAVYAFKTRKTPDGFNETKFIGFTSYTTGLIWLAFMPLYFATTNYWLRVFTLCIGLSLNASVVLACLFVPKAYVCLCRPEKNTREAIMTRSVSVTSGTVFLEPPFSVQQAAHTATIEGCEMAEKKIQRSEILSHSTSEENRCSNPPSAEPSKEEMRVVADDEIYGTSREPICDSLSVELTLQEARDSEQKTRKTSLVRVETARVAKKAHIAVKRHSSERCS